MEAKREEEPYRFGDLLPGAVYVPSFLPREEAEELFQMVKIQWSESNLFNLLEVRRSPQLYARDNPEERSPDYYFWQAREWFATIQGLLVLIWNSWSRRISWVHQKDLWTVAWSAPLRKHAFSSIHQLLHIETISDNCSYLILFIRLFFDSYQNDLQFHKDGVGSHAAIISLHSYTTMELYKKANPWPILGTEVYGASVDPSEPTPKPEDYIHILLEPGSMLLLSGESFTGL